jgi:tRNA threonylcarbamoyl adenosine modification protein YeaZ
MSEGLDYCLDLSGPRQSLAVCRGEEVLQEIEFCVPRRTTGPVFSHLRDLLERWGTPGRALVGVGPGSYNGLRAALALAAGLRLGIGVPLRGVSSLLVLAGAPKDAFWVLGDARGSQFYLARVEGFRFLEEPLLFGLEAALERVESIGGPVFRVGDHPQLLPWPELAPRAALLPLAAAHNLDDKEVEWPQPLYLKPPHITPKRPDQEPTDEVKFKKSR